MCLDGLSQMAERLRARTHMRVHRVCSAVWRRRPPSRREDRGGDAVMGASDGRQEQASSSSQQEQSESSRVRRIMGLETWTAEGGARCRRGGAGAEQAVPNDPESGSSSGATHVPDRTSTILSSRTLPRCGSRSPRKHRIVRVLWETLMNDHLLKKHYPLRY